MDDAARLVEGMLASAPAPSREVAEAYVATLVRRGANVADFDPGDAALVAGCLAGSPGAIRRFEERYFGGIAAALRTIGDAGFVDEVKQLLRLRLFVPEPDQPSMLESYLGRGSIQGWLRVSAVRLALDLRRRHGHDVHDADPEIGDRVDVGTLEPELDHLRSRHADDFRAAFDEALASLTPAERSLLRFYFVDRLAIHELAVLLHLPRSTAARRLAQVREEVVRVTRERLRARLSLSTLELDSLLHALESVVDVSLASALDRLSPEAEPKPDP